MTDAIPASSPNATRPDGRSPDASPTAIGTIAPTVDATGATIPTDPTEKPRYRAPTPTADPAPARSPYATSGAMYSLPMKTATIATTGIPTHCDHAATANGLDLREATLPKKSAAPMNPTDNMIMRRTVWVTRCYQGADGRLAARCVLCMMDDG